MWNAFDISNYFFVKKINKSNSIIHNMITWNQRKRTEGNYALPVTVYLLFHWVEQFNYCSGGTVIKLFHPWRECYGLIYTNDVLTGWSLERGSGVLQAGGGARPDGVGRASTALARTPEVERKRRHNVYTVQLMQLNRMRILFSIIQFKPLN